MRTAAAAAAAAAAYAEVVGRRPRLRLPADVLRQKLVKTYLKLKDAVLLGRNSSTFAADCFRGGE